MTATEKIGTVSAKSVKKHTKKDWDEWTTLLNKSSYQNLSHKELVKVLATKFKLTPWWQQVVARGYQISLGLRVPNQTLKGTYTTTATKSVTIPVKKVFEFIISTEGQKLWLDPLYPIKVAPLLTSSEMAEFLENLEP